MRMIICAFPQTYTSYVLGNVAAGSAFAMAQSAGAAGVLFNFASTFIHTNSHERKVR